MPSAATIVRLLRPQRPTIDWDFLANPTLPAGVTFTRADAGSRFNSAGLLESVAANLARFTWNNLTLKPEGLLLEGARTNLLLWNRDLTNAAWVKTNVTATKDQTGLDGAANSATRLTATAANGTCLQAVTFASGNKIVSAWIRRITGTGNIDMTLDGGTTWTTVTVTSAWTRVFVTQAALANPNSGFRFVTSGDEIAVDAGAVSNNALNPASPLLTTTAAVSRALDSFVLPLTPDLLRADEFTFAVEMMLPVLLTNSTAAGVVLDDGTVNNYARLGFDSTSLVQMQCGSGAVSQANITGATAVAGQVARLAGRVKANDFLFCANGVASARDANGLQPVGLTQLLLGSRADGTQNPWGTVQRFRLWRGGMSDTAVRRLTEA
jgi:hypothetical protein